MRLWMAIPPPSALVRSILRSSIVSAWSKIQANPSNGMSRLTFSNTSKKRLILSLYVACNLNGHRLLTSKRTTFSSSASIFSLRSGLGCRKSSKSAAEKTSISPAPLWRYMSSPWWRGTLSIHCWKSSYSCLGFCVKRL